MNITTVFRLEWDKDHETLREFKKKYDSLRKHVEIMQLKGLMPQGDVRWICVRSPVGIDAEQKGGPGQVIPFLTGITGPVPDMSMLMTGGVDPSTRGVLVRGPARLPHEALRDGKRGETVTFGPSCVSDWPGIQIVHKAGQRNEITSSRPMGPLVSVRVDEEFGEPDMI